LKTRSRSSLHGLGRLLSGALGKAAGPQDLPANDAEWQRVLRLSNDHLAAPLLRWALKEQGRFSDLKPDAAELLEAVYTLNLDRNRRCVDQLAHLTEVLNRIDVRPVVLKGAATLVGGLYPTLGERMISDLDVLIPESRLPEILERLAGEGYRLLEGETELPEMMDFADLVGLRHYPRIGSPDWPAGVELHVSPIPLSASRLLSAEEMIEEATPLSWRGGELLTPSPTHFIVHNVIHAFVVDFRKKGWLSFRQAFEFAHANRVYGERVDWNAVVRRFHEFDRWEALSGYTTFAHAYLGFPMPPGVKVRGWDGWRASFRLTRLGIVSRPLWNRIYRLRTDSLPLTLAKPRKLLRVEWYSGLWREWMAILRNN
jgi:Uncharacterised nucleotidyltransferase